MRHSEGARKSEAVLDLVLPPLQSMKRADTLPAKQRQSTVIQFDPDFDIDL